MGSLWLTSTADWLRAAGVHVVEYDGWKTRARSSGGYEPGRPHCVMWHHTASATSPANDCNYMCHGADARPVANVLIARDGAVWLMAAGATNTNGSGRSISFSRGTVPTDSMNSYAFGMEIANNGVGEDYPQAQVDAAFRVSNTMNARLGNQPGDVSTHQFYAPDRKVDPAMGGNNVQGPWHPRECTNAGSWNRDDLVAECKRRGSPPPPPEDDDMPHPFDGIWQMSGASAQYAVYKGGYKVWIPDSATLEAKRALCAINGLPQGTNIEKNPAMFKAFGPVLGVIPSGYDEYGLKK
jgi:hypothetical protein